MFDWNGRVRGAVLSAVVNVPTRPSNVFGAIWIFAPTSSGPVLARDLARCVGDASLPAATTPETLALER